VSGGAATKAQSSKENNPAQGQIRNPKPEIRNKSKQMEILKMKQRSGNNFLAAFERFELLWCNGILRAFSSAGAAGLPPGGSPRSAQKEGGQ
jgi:hypothetical protein